MTTIIPFKMVSITSPDPVEAGGLMIQNNFKIIANYLETISGNIDNKGGGITPTITVGSVTTLDSSASAYVTNVGDLTAAVFNFGIPKGNDGLAGISGSNGFNGLDGVNGLAATITVGSVTTLDSSASAYVTNVGDLTAAVFNFGIPKGPQGDSSSGGSSGNLLAVNNLSDVQNSNISRTNINKGQVELFADGSLNVATDCSLGNVFFLNLNDNYILTNPSNKSAGATYLWRIMQSITGGNTLSFNTVFKWAGGTPPTITTAASAVDVISAISDGTYLYSAIIQDLK